MAENEAELRDEAERCLRALAGEHARLREDQWTAIRALVADRRRALVVQRTGWGKSAVYFIATALLRARGAGPTVIVSPLSKAPRPSAPAGQWQTVAPSKCPPNRTSRRPGKGSTLSPSQNT